MPFGGTLFIVARGMRAARSACRGFDTYQRPLQLCVRYQPNARKDDDWQLVSFILVYKYPRLPLGLDSGNPRVSPPYLAVQGCEFYGQVTRARIIMSPPPPPARAQ